LLRENSVVKLRSSYPRHQDGGIFDKGVWHEQERRKRNKANIEGSFQAFFLFRGSWPAEHVTICDILAEDLNGDRE